MAAILMIDDERAILELVKNGEMKKENGFSKILFLVDFPQ